MPGNDRYLTTPQPGDLGVEVTGVTVQLEAHKTTQAADGTVTIRSLKLGIGAGVGRGAEQETENSGAAPVIPGKPRIKSPKEVELDRATAEAAKRLQMLKEGRAYKR